MDKGKVFLILLSLLFAVNNSLTAQSTSCAAQRIELQIKTGAQIIGTKSSALNVANGQPNFLVNDRFLITVQAGEIGNGQRDLFREDDFLLAAASPATIDNLIANQPITTQDILASQISNNHRIVRARRFEKPVKTLVYTATQP